MTSKVEVVVLGRLAEEPLYGYDLLERFRTRSMGLWVEIGKASVYQVLRRLERDGSVVGRSQDGPEGPDRRVYRITRAGRDRLEEGSRIGSGRWSRTRRPVAWRWDSRTCFPPRTRARRSTNGRRRSGTCSMRSRPSARGSPRTRVRVERYRPRCSNDRSRSRKRSSRGSRGSGRIWGGSVASR